MNLKQAGLGCIVVAMCFCMLAPAEMPRQFYYEDYCNGTNGLPYTGVIHLQLQLYSTATNGACLYEDSNTVEVVDGFYATLIGDNTVAGSLTNALAGGQTYVQVIIDGTPLSPREPLVPVPYALNAAGVASNAITAAMISSSAVQASHLSSGSVTASKLASDVVEQYVDASGDVMTGSLDMGGHSIVNARFVGDGAGLTNLPMTGLTSNAADDRYVNVAGDTVQGDLRLLASLRGYAGNFADTNLVLNPTFDTTGAPWTDGSGWSYWHQGRVQVACNSSGGIYDRISQSVSGLVPGVLYRVSYDIVENNWVSPLEPGTVRIYFGHQLDSVSNTTVGTHTSYFTATNDTINLALWSLLWRQGATLAIDNISLSPATLNDQILYVNPTTGLRELNVQSIAGPVSISNNLEVSGSASIAGELSASSFTGDGSGLRNISASSIDGGGGSGLDADLLDGLDSADFAPNPHEHDDEYVNATGDTMTGDFSLAGSLILLPTTEIVLSSGFQTDGNVMIHWMTDSGTYFKHGETASGGERFHFGSDGTFQAWGDIYARGEIRVDGGLSVGGGAIVTGGLSAASLSLGGQARTNWYRSFVENGENGEFVPAPQATGSNSVAFGQENRALGHFSFVGGGISNLADGAFSLVAGGYQNYARSNRAIVVGGGKNQAYAGSFVGAGTANTATGNSFVVGGWANKANGSSFIGAGSQNIGDRTSFVGGGEINWATGIASVVAGGSGNRATAKGAAVAGGYLNYAMGEYSFAGGLRAQAIHNGSFVWSDSLHTNTSFASITSNEFAIGAASGVRIVGSGLSTDGRILAAGSGKTSEFFAVKSTGGVAVGGGLSVGGGANVAGNLSVGNHIAIDAAAGSVAASSVSIGSVVLGGASNALVVPSLADSVSGAVRIGVDEGTLYGDWELEGRGSVKYEPAIGTNQYALWVRNFGSTPDDARGLLVTTPEYSNGEGIIFHAASKAGGSMASRFIVGTDGNVGVGVNNPQNKLHVAGDVRASGNLLMMDGQNIISPNVDPGAWGSAYDKWGPNAYLKYGFVRELLVAQNAEFQRKVKIGTGSEYAMLNVGAPTNLATPTYAARFESALGADSDKARGLLINFPNTTNANSILFHAMSGPGPYINSRVVIKADGKVGIGTSYPEATLHVHGDARFDQVVWIQPAGDLSMGSYTNGAPQ